MATRKRAKGDQEPSESEPRRPSSAGYESESEAEGQGELEEGEAVRVHEAYLDHRLGGGRAAEPAAYAQAIEQFEKLPGAVRVTPPPPEQRGEDEHPRGDKGEETEA